MASQSGGLSLARYEAVLAFLQEHADDRALFAATFPEVSYDTVRAIDAQNVREAMRHRTVEMNRSKASLTARYEAGASLVALADELAVAPCLLAKAVLSVLHARGTLCAPPDVSDSSGLDGPAMDGEPAEDVAAEGSGAQGRTGAERANMRSAVKAKRADQPDGGSAATARSVTNDRARRKHLAAYLAAPEQLSDRRLGAQLAECAAADPYYGPGSDVLRRAVGLEYEFRLQEHVRALGVPHTSEHEMRDQRFTKTPDVKLDAPLLIGRVAVNWLESKAVFGDAQTVAQVADQLRGYVERYGPGAVLFWFGFVSELVTSLDGVLVLARWPPKAAIRALS